MRDRKISNHLYYLKNKKRILARGIIYQRKRRKLTNNAVTKRYEKTQKGFLMRAYRNMQSRVTGIQKTKYYLYKGKYLLPRQEFYNWSLNNNNFLTLFDLWEQSQYSRKLTPSIDRINSDLGYEISNMRWVTFLENCRNVRQL